MDFEIKSWRVDKTETPFPKHQKRQRRNVVTVVPATHINSVQHIGRCVGSVGKQMTSKQCAGTTMAGGTQCMK